MFGRKQNVYVGFNPFSKQQKEKPSISQKIINKIKYWFTDYLNPSSCIQREIISQQTIYVPVSCKIVDAQTIEQDSIQICQSQSSQKQKRNKFQSFDEHFKEQEALLNQDSQSKIQKKESKLQLKTNEMKSSFDQVLPDNIDPQQPQDPKQQRPRRITSSHLYKKRKLNEKQKQIGIKFVHKKHVIDQIQDSINESGIQVIPEEASEDSLKNNSLLRGKLTEEPKDVVIEIIAPLVKNEPPAKEPPMLTPVEIIETHQKGLKKSQSILNLNEQDTKSRKQSEVIIKLDEQKKETEQVEQQQETKVVPQLFQLPKNDEKEQQVPKEQSTNKTIVPTLGLFNNLMPNLNPSSLFEKKSENTSLFNKVETKPEEKKVEEKKQPEQQQGNVTNNVSDTPLFGLSKIGENSASLLQPRKILVESSQFTNAFDSKDQQQKTSSDQSSGQVLQQNLFTFTQNKPQEKSSEQIQPPSLNTSDSAQKADQLNKPEDKAPILSNFNDSLKSNEQSNVEEKRDEKEKETSKPLKISIFSNLTSLSAVSANQQEKKDENQLPSKPLGFFGNLIQPSQSSLTQPPKEVQNTTSTTQPEVKTGLFNFDSTKGSGLFDNFQFKPKADEKPKPVDVQSKPVEVAPKPVDVPQDKPQQEIFGKSTVPSLFEKPQQETFGKITVQIQPLAPQKQEEKIQLQTQTLAPTQSSLLFGGLTKQENNDQSQQGAQGSSLFGNLLQKTQLETPKNQESKQSNEKQKNDLQTPTPSQIGLNCQWKQSSGDQKVNPNNSNDKIDQPKQSPFAFLLNQNSKDPKSDQQASGPAKQETPGKLASNPFLQQSPKIDQEQINSYFSNNSGSSQIKHQPNIHQTQRFDELFKQQQDTPSVFNLSMAPPQNSLFQQQPQNQSMFQYQPQQQSAVPFQQNSMFAQNTSMNNEMEITDCSPLGNQLFPTQIKPTIGFNPPPFVQQQQQNPMFFQTTAQPTMGQSLFQNNDLTNQLSSGNNQGQISSIYQGLFSQELPKTGQQSGSLNSSFTSKPGGKKKQRIV